MARVIGTARQPEPDEQGRPCVVFDFMTMDPSLPDKMDFNQERIIYDPSESAQVFNGRIRDAARGQIARLNTLHGLSMTVGSGDCIVPQFIKV